jgi:hypothetical protein
MKGEVYMIQAVKEALPFLRLTPDQIEDLDNAFTALSEGDTLDSRIVFPDGTPAGGLRELDRKDLRIFFRLDPENGNVMIADIRPTSYIPAPALENELAVSS